mgnify:FL=1
MNRAAKCLTIFVTMSITSCATTGDDPLKNTKKLAREGHLSLYRNGAFNVPSTSITLIPPAPSTYEFATELMGLRARESFLLALKRASESVYIVSEGAELTFSVAENIKIGSFSGADEIRRLSKKSGSLLIYRSSELGRNIVGKSWEFSLETKEDIDRMGASISKWSVKKGESIERKGVSQGREMAGDSIEMAGKVSEKSLKRAGASVTYAKESFVLGYAALPARTKERARKVGDSISDLSIVKIIKEEDERRGRWAGKAVDLFGETVNEYSGKVSETFGKAGEEFRETYKTSGLSLAALKSLRHVIQGVFWDATIEPMANITAASVGYIAVNTVAFPVMVVTRSGIATANVAIEVTWNSAGTGYDIVAPSATAAMAGLYSLVDLGGSHLFAGAAATTGNIVGYSEAGAAKVAGLVVKGGGSAAGKSVQYIGAPLAAAGIAVGSGTVGTAVAVGEAAAGGTILVTGEAASLATKSVGYVASGATVAAGTTVSAGAGGAYGIYQISKAVAVPAGYEFGGGMVLGYETLSQLGAQTILAASDATYMVLSLEGPRWLIYAVKEKSGRSEDLQTGTILDMKKMQEAGEEIYYIPVSDDEMRKIVSSAYETLPELK